MTRRMNEFLEIDESNGREVIRCKKCQYEFSSITENYKRYAKSTESQLNKAGPKYFFRPSKNFVLREYYCPSCAVLLDVEMVEKHEEPVWNIQLKPQAN